MPTYEYQCEKCGPIELWQSIKDNALSACPTCGAKVERQISANVGFIFKGSGFYQNEYKNPPKSSEVVSPTASTTPPKVGSELAPKDASKPEVKPSEKVASSSSTTSTPLTSSTDSTPAPRLPKTSSPSRREGPGGHVGQVGGSPNAGPLGNN